MRLIKYMFVSGYNFKRTKSCRRKIKKIARNLQYARHSFDKAKIISHQKQWKKLKKNVNPLWFKVFSYLSGMEDINYVPEDIYYTVIEPCLNNKQVNKSYADKNIYDIFFEKNLFPKTLLRNIDGNFYDENYNRLLLETINFEKWGDTFPKLIIKPALDSGGGKDVGLFSFSGENYTDKNGRVLDFIWMQNKYNRNYLIQPYIEQHSFFRQFNEDSVNTVRVFTYRSVKDDVVIPLHTLLRIGRKGSHVDNQASGGISCGIDKSGNLNGFAMDKYGVKYFNVNGVSLDKNYQLPWFDKIIKTAINLASKNLHSRLLGYDFCVDINENLKIIEINNLNNEINFYQMNNGSLFGEYTQEIIDYCASNVKTFVLDYDY